MFLLSISTFKLSSFNRLPLQISQISSDHKSFTPKPWHSGQAPYGLLNENRRGSISGKEKPSFGQVNFAESETSLSVMIVTTSLPYLMPDSMASARRRRLS